MKVRAIKRGFFDGRYRLPGDEFDCPSESQFSKRWMEKLKKGRKAKIEPPKAGEYVPLETPTLIKEEFGLTDSPE